MSWFSDPFQEGSVTSAGDPFAGADPFNNAFGVTAAQTTKVNCSTTFQNLNCILIDTFFCLLSLMLGLFVRNIHTYSNCTKQFQFVLYFLVKILNWVILKPH